MRRTKRGGWPYSQPPNVPFTINRASSQSTGIVGWWPTIASRGTHVLRDFSGNGFDGTFQGAGEPAWAVNGQHGQVLDFDGSNDKITIPHDTRLKPAKITVCVWARRTGPGSHATQTLIDCHDWGANTGYLLLLDPEDTAIVWRVCGNGGKHNLSANVTTADWHHYCGTFDGSNSYIYVDGIQKNSMVAELDANALILNIGVEAGGWGYFEGLMANFRIYNRAFSDAEVWALYDLYTRWELYKPLIPWTLAKSPITVRIPRYGFTNFQVPGIV